MAADAKSDSEVRLERISVLGPELGPVFHGLDRELLWVQVKWEEYKALFAMSPESVEVLNTLAPFFWRKHPNGDVGRPASAHMSAN